MMDIDTKYIEIMHQITVKFGELEKLEHIIRITGLILSDGFSGNSTISPRLGISQVK